MFNFRGRPRGITPLYVEFEEKLATKYDMPSCQSWGDMSWSPGPTHEQTATVPERQNFDTELYNNTQCLVIYEVC